MTVVVLTTPADREKARTVGDRVPERCLGNPDYRMITIMRFVRRHTVVGRRIATAFIRHRVNDEAKRLQARYEGKKIARDARKDIFVATDFDGSISSQLGEAKGATDFCVFVFGRNGELIAQWHGVPSAEQLATALNELPATAFRIPWLNEDFLNISARWDRLGPTTHRFRLQDCKLWQNHAAVAVVPPERYAFHCDNEL